MQPKIRAYISLTLAMIIVGSSVVFGKVITHAFPVFLASGLRFAIASMMMIPIVFMYEKKRLTVSKKDGLKLFFMAFCGQFVFTFLVLLGLRYTSAIEAGIITSTSPAMMVMVAYLLFKDRPNTIQIVAVLLVVAGIISVNGFVNFENLSVSKSHIFGNLLMVGAVVGEAFFLLMRKHISSDISNLALTAYLCFLGFIMFLPFSIYQAISFDFSSVTLTAWCSMLYFGAVFTVLAYLFWFQGVSKVSGNTAGMFTAVMPISAVLLSCMFLQEQLTIHHAFGGVLILIAILLFANASGKK
ncbi:MAG: DMT family transporter [Desulfobacteraceae bacterium]|nr:DMT family transporter [Desulfobacteraceae bacterium]